MEGRCNALVNIKKAHTSLNKKRAILTRNNKITLDQIELLFKKAFIAFNQSFGYLSIRDLDTNGYLSFRKLHTKYGEKEISTTLVYELPDNKEISFNIKNNEFEVNFNSEDDLICNQKFLDFCEKNYKVILNMVQLTESYARNFKSDYHIESNRAYGPVNLVSKIPSSSIQEIFIGDLNLKVILNATNFTITVLSNHVISYENITIDKRKINSNIKNFLND